jgi:phenylacetate-CoA ligase
VCKNNSFYKNKYRNIGFEIGDLKTPDDFERLPILEKHEIRDHALEIVSDGYNVKSLIPSMTGGSTGEPLVTYRDATTPQHEISWRTLNWWGVDPSDNSAYLYRAVPDDNQQFIQKALLWPTKRNWIAATDMSPDRMENFFRKLLRDRPKYLVGYVGAIDVFANFMEKNRYSLSGLKAVWTTSSPLTEGKRLYLKKMYQSKVFTQYGSCEFYWIASECKKQNGMHIASDIRHVDVVNNNKPVEFGEYGDLVVTDLTNFAFPLIRYRLGDRGRLLKRKCDCGLPFPLMDYVYGRISDCIYLPGGKIVPGEYWTTIFDNHTDSIKSFQVFQAVDYSITVKYQPLSDLISVDNAIRDVRRMLLNKLGEGIALTFKLGIVNVSENGKTRYVLSAIKR